MARTPAPAAKKPRHRYHHGNLRPALLRAAVDTIQAEGVEALTLRAVGSSVGVSRTALYRHFTDKSALLAAVAAEGFRLLREALTTGWESQGRGRKGFEAMGLAYVRFAVANPSHYRVMFGAVIDEAANPQLAQEGAAAFAVLVDGLVALQKGGHVRGDDPLALAHYVWAVVHGIAMLALDGRLRHQHADVEELTRFAIKRLRTGIDTDP